MCSFVSVGVLLVLLALLAYNGYNGYNGWNTHEPFVSLPTRFTPPLTKDTVECTADKTKCCPAAYHYPQEQCSGFDFTRPSNFNTSLTLTVPSSVEPPSVPVCKVNKMTDAQRNALSVPQNISLSENTNLASELGAGANQHMQAMCQISQQADTVQHNIDALNAVIATANANAAQNSRDSVAQNGRTTAQKQQAKQMWNNYCDGYVYQDTAINRECASLGNFAKPPTGMDS